MFYCDPLYFIVAIPGLLLALAASAVTKFTFTKYSKVAASSGMTGAEAARAVLRAEGVTDVTIEQTQGFLSDHYDPSSNTLRLSPDVYHSNSLSAIGVACHEAGHALQKAHQYGPLAMRSNLVPVTQIGSHLAPLILMVGFFMQSPFLVQAGIILFSGVVIFTLVTLPVEWNASARAKELMVQARVVTMREQPQAAAVLNAAFMTYVAAAVSAVLTLLYFLMRAGLLGNRRDD
ncbi:MAG: zinc metallopeptidase [Kiritimatiellaceae bacterium]|nr:zinc metallopeptidase [Kiritimatiellaceae bacterium]